MSVCRPLFTDEEHAARTASYSQYNGDFWLCVRTIGKMSYGLNNTGTLQMCTVKIENGLGYKSSRVRVQVQQSGLKSGLESKYRLEY